MTDSVIETVTIAHDEAGSRLDRVLAAHIATLSRSHLKTLILGGHVMLAGRTIRDPAAAVKPGDVITGIGYQFADGQKIVRLERVVLADGKELRLYGR